MTGGWGGDIVGLSSIDGWDASDNETRAYFNFETGRWYSFRLLVTAQRIRAWIDDQQIINVAIAGDPSACAPGTSNSPRRLASLPTTRREHCGRSNIASVPSGRS